MEGGAVKLRWFSKDTSAVADTNMKFTAERVYEHDIMGHSHAAVQVHQVVGEDEHWFTLSRHALLTLLGLTEE